VEGKTLTFGRWAGLISLLISLSVLWQVRSIVLLFFMAVPQKIASSESAQHER